MFQGLSPCPQSSSLFRRFRRHLGPPFVVRHLSPPDSSCPVASLEDLLRSRDAMGIRHAYVFSSSAPPHDPISVSSFSGLLRWAFQRAGISAPPGSTRAISVSDAVARGVSVEEALHRRRLVRCRHLLSSLPSSIWLDCDSVISSPRTCHFMDDEGGRAGLLFLLFLSPLGRVPRDRINEFLFIHLHPIVDQEKILR